MLSAVEIGLCIAGIALGVLINYWIYSLAYFARPISPWQARPVDMQPLSPASRIPVVGWFVRRSESVRWGKGFWIRPMLIEAAIPGLWVWLYRALFDGITVPLGIRTPGPGFTLVGSAVSISEVHVQFLAYSVLLVLMIVATFIDIDERTIPDWITIPGTWIGVLGAALLPGWCLWEATQAGPPVLTRLVTPMHANSPYPWSIDLGQIGGWGPGLWWGLLIWVLWCASLGNLRWITRRGFRKAFTYAWIGFLRSHNLKAIGAMAVVGSLLIVFAYMGLSPERWQSLLSSLFGIGLGGSLVWSFRIVAGGVLGQEALGFGDVTLMAMVGAFFGWQIAVVAFFLAPLFGIVLVLLYWIITRDGAIPFGPYLAAATAYLMLDWPRVWDALSIVFLPVQSYFFFLIVLLVVLGSLLWVVRSLKVLLLGVTVDSSQATTTEAKKPR